MEFLKKLRNYTFALIFLYGIIGIIMIINPSFIFDMINYIMGFFIIIYGIIYLANLFFHKSEFSINRLNILVGVLCIAFGVFILLNKDMITLLIPFCFSILIFVDGLYQIGNAIKIKRYHARYWWINLIVGIIFIVFAGLVMFYAKEISDWMVRIIGIFLILDVIFDVYSIVRVNKIVSKMKVIESESR